MLAAACGDDGGSRDGDGAPPQGSGGAGLGTGGAVEQSGGASGVTGGGSSLGGGIPTAACQGSLPRDDTSAAAHKVTVQSATSWGALPHFWSTYGVGRMGLYLQADRDWGTILRNHTVDGVQNLDLKSLRMHGLFHDDVGIYHEEGGQPVYDFAKSDQVFDFFVENRIAPIVELAPMPSDLASDPTKTVFAWSMGISPPKDFALWQELILRFVEHSVERYGAEVVSDWYFEVWNEPECCNHKFWTGTLEQYFELYDRTAAGVRAALPGGRIGGPVASQPAELTTNSKIGQLFLDHVTTDNYVNPGSPGVLDFFAYHSWSFVGGAVDGYFQGLDLLDSYGLTNVPIAVTEFGPTWEFGLYDEPQETDQGAVFVAQVYSDISTRAAQGNRRFPIAYAWWVLSDVFDEDPYREADPFIGCMGLTSREGIRKPAYNAYKFLAQMGDEQLAFSVEGSGDVGGMAARDDAGGMQIIIYNGNSPGRGPSDDTYYGATESEDIAVTLEGLNPGSAYNVTEYRIDASHGNAYATWQAQGRPTMAEMSNTDWQALRDTMDSTGAPLGQALCGSSFKKTFSLASPGVLFITLTPATE